MMWRRACPRCRGDLVLELDHFGEFISCFQCGTILDDSQESSLRALAAARRFFEDPGRRPAILEVQAATRPAWGRG